jgi:hypothetical protein
MISKLGRVQRLALLNIFGVMQSTPTAAMEALSGLEPLHLYLLGLGLRTMNRLYRQGYWSSTIYNSRNSTHTAICNRLRVGIPELWFPCDHTSEFLPTGRLFRGVVKPRTQWERDGSPERSVCTLNCYTDGLGMEDRTCAAYYLSDRYPEEIFPLGSYATLIRQRCLLFFK